MIYIEEPHFLYEGSTSVPLKVWMGIDTTFTIVIDIDIDEGADVEPS